jgi:hypothetical protein
MSDTSSHRRRRPFPRPCDPRPAADAAPSRRERLALAIAPGLSQRQRIADLEERILDLEADLAVERQIATTHKRVRLELTERLLWPAEGDLEPTVRR